MQEKNGAAVLANLLTGLGIDEFFTRTDGNGTKSLLHDALGSTIALDDGTGSLSTQYTYEPFGATVQLGQPSPTSYHYTGREEDGTGLYYYRARYYSPRLQRFISEDPMGFTGGINLYAYVGNQPLRYTDATGLFADTFFDVGFIIYDLYQLATSGRKDVGTNLTALGADVLSALTPGATGLGLGVRAAENARRFNVEQQALVELAKEAKASGVTKADAQTLLDWARELGINPALDHIGTTHWVGGDHIRLGPVNHIPVR